MKFLKFAAVLTVLAIFAISCGQNPTTTNTAASNKNPSANNAPTNQTTPAVDEFAAVRKTFAEKCIVCHKETGEGGEVNLEGDKFKVPNLKDEKVKALDDKKYTRVIEDGDDKMPAFKNKLKPEEIAGLIKFIRKEIQGK